VIGHAEQPIDSQLLERHLLERGNLRPRQSQLIT